MSWNPEKIRFLRQRMGWSQSDLARRLQCESALVIDWEVRGRAPHKMHLQTLELLSFQAENIMDQVLASPLAEIMMDETRQSQITLESVKKRFSERN